MCAVFFTALKLFEGNPAGILPFLQASPAVGTVVFSAAVPHLCQQLLTSACVQPRLQEKWLPTVCTSMAGALSGGVEQ